MRLMGFGAIWLGWVKACVLSSSLSILVNGSPTNHFQAHRGLTQGGQYPFSCFY